MEFKKKTGPEKKLDDQQLIRNNDTIDTVGVHAIVRRRANNNN